MERAWVACECPKPKRDAGDRPGEREPPPRENALRAGNSTIPLPRAFRMRRTRA
jgi:hypothetical protein